MKSLLNEAFHHILLELGYIIVTFDVDFIQIFMRLQLKDRDQIEIAGENIRAV